MNFTYLENFTKTTVEDMAKVQEAIKSAGVVIDSKLFPVIEEAENGDFGAQAELYEMFAFGENGVTPNYEMAYRYWEKLKARNEESGDKELISESLNNLAFLHLQFDKMAIARDSFIEAFTYMVSNLEPHLWERQMIELMHSNIDVYIPEEN